MRLNFDLLLILKGMFYRLYQVPIFVYHSISGNSDNAIPLDIFKRHLDFFCRHRLEILSVSQLVKLVLGQGKPRYPCVTITFDDGYVDFYNLVFPLVKKNGIPVALFVVVKNIGQPNYLNLKQLQEIATCPLVTVGSHSMTHSSDLVSLDREGLYMEIVESKRELERILQKEIDYFAYPWGFFSHSVKDMVRQADYRAAFSTNLFLGKRFTRPDIFSLCRLTPRRDDSKLRFLVKSSGLGTYFSRRIK